MFFFRNSSLAFFSSVILSCSHLLSFFSPSWFHFWTISLFLHARGIRFTAWLFIQASETRWFGNLSHSFGASLKMQCGYITSNILFKFPNWLVFNGHPAYQFRLNVSLDWLRYGFWCLVVLVLALLIVAFWLFTISHKLILNASCGSCCRQFV